MLAAFPSPAGGGRGDGLEVSANCGSSAFPKSRSLSVDGDGLRTRASPKPRDKREEFFSPAAQPRQPSEEDTTRLAPEPTNGAARAVGSGQIVSSPALTTGTPSSAGSQSERHLTRVDRWNMAASAPAGPCAHELAAAAYAPTPQVAAHWCTRQVAAVQRRARSASDLSGAWRSGCQWGPPGHTSGTPGARGRARSHAESGVPSPCHGEVAGASSAPLLGPHSSVSRGTSPNRVIVDSRCEGGVGGEGCNGPLDDVEILFFAEGQHRSCRIGISSQMPKSSSEHGRRPSPFSRISPGYTAGDVDDCCTVDQSTVGGSQRLCACGLLATDCLTCDDPEGAPPLPASPLVQSGPRNSSVAAAELPQLAASACMPTVRQCRKCPARGPLGPPSSSSATALCSCGLVASECLTCDDGDDLGPVHGFMASPSVREHWRRSATLSCGAAELQPGFNRPGSHMLPGRPGAMQAPRVPGRARMPKSSTIAAGRADVLRGGYVTAFNSGYSSAAMSRSASTASSSASGHVRRWTVDGSPFSGVGSGAGTPSHVGGSNGGSDSDVFSWAAQQRMRREER